MGRCVGGFILTSVIVTQTNYEQLSLTPLTACWSLLLSLWRGERVLTDWEMGEGRRETERFLPAYSGLEREICENVMVRLLLRKE